MRNPAIRVLLVALLAVALVAGVGIVVSGDASSSQTPEQYVASASPIFHSDSTFQSDSRFQSDSTFQPAPTRMSESASIGAVSPTDSVSQISTAFDPDSETQIRIHLQPDRDAQWEIAIRYEFDDADQTAPFERVGERFLDGDIGPDPALFERFAADASANVNRDMEITEVDREVVVIDDPEEMELENQSEDGEVDGVEEPPVAVGELRLTFVWTEFLAEDGDNLELGDAFTTADDGTWLQSLDASQTIEVMTPEGYSVSGTPGAAVPLQDNAVIIEGPRVFEGDDRVVVVYSPTSPQQPTEPSTPPWTLLAGAIVLAALLIAGGLLGYRRVGTEADNGGDRANNGGTAGPADGTDAHGETEAVPGGTTGDGPGSGDGDGQGDEGTAGGEDLSLLSDEERVERLLERNGGRMRQADIVAETGWSDAKVSQLLSAMSNEGRVEKLRLGRENLISVPDDGPSDGETGPGSSDD